ncbi:MAG: hypothetical protein H0U29_08450, partial [Acidimicrobiia bacterium]|nr:hypothetical protein [Acidimicrobiia bacterium]
MRLARPGRARSREAEALSTTSTLTDGPARSADRTRATASAARTIRPRPGLPGSRAVVGGLLVALAAVGTWWAASGAGRSAEERYVVASRTVGPGERIEADDVRLATLDLPDSLRPMAFLDARSVIGSVALGPLEPGELLQAGSIAPAAGSPDTREVSFAVETDWAVAGSLRAGDRIDVFATYEGTGAPTSTRVLTNATVRRVGATGDEGLGESRTQTITVAVDGPDGAKDLVTAARAATITVLRVTGT